MASDGNSRFSINRRTMLVGGGAAVGLAVAWAAWPRRFPPNLVAREGETVLNAFLKIGTDGRVVVAVPQAEMGQGVFTGLPQILADELGADWQMVGVEPAPIHPAYVNMAMIEDGVRGALPEWLHGVGRWVGAEVGRHYQIQLTGGSSSVRAFLTPLREAGAMARIMLCQAAAARWGVDWRECRADGNQIVHGKNILGFGAVAAEAATLAPPGEITLRPEPQRRLFGRPLPRLDAPAKADGSAVFGADVRLPDMLFASVRRAPPGGGRAEEVEQERAKGVRGLVAVVDTPGWVAAVATNWWAADRALDLVNPRFASDNPPADQGSIDSALSEALAGDARSFESIGDATGALAGEGVVTALYSVPPVTHAAMETLTATARLSEEGVEIWAPTQSSSMTRLAVARALGVGEDGVTIYPTLIGGGFGRKVENDAAIQAALIARKVAKPVQLVWSRAEESIQGGPRPPARARLRALLAPDKSIAAWETVIAAPSAMAEMVARMRGKADRPVEAEAGAVEGAVPAYNIPALRVAHAPADVGFPTGIWRSVANSYTAFFTEAFVDELAAAAGLDPLAFRLRLLAGKPRHAEALKTAASLGSYAPAAGEAAQGLALHECFGSIVAMLAEVEMEGGAPKVRRIVAAVDCGRIVNPELVRQQIEGGIIWGLAAALTGEQSWTGGMPDQRNFDGFGLPLLADTPEIEVHLMENGEAPGGVGEIAVPPVAPAIANAMFVATGKRFRQLPLLGRQGA
jgi:isoquinoline 1-oxidoreductase beta subunit